jgi:hypothetical protein
MSAMDEPDFSPRFARQKMTFAAGQRWQKVQPFVQEDVEVYSHIHGEMRTIKSWRPGLRFLQTGPADFDADSDGEGYEVRTIAAVVNIPGEVSRILYRKSWVDPGGKAFGKRKMLMTTPAAFSAWVRDSNQTHRQRVMSVLVETLERVAA